MFGKQIKDLYLTRYKTHSGVAAAAVSGNLDLATFLCTFKCAIKGQLPVWSEHVGDVQGAAVSHYKRRGKKQNNIKITSSNFWKMKNLIEYKAGLMVSRDRVIEPDSRKGLLFLRRIEDEVHICWKDRQSGKVEMDIVAVPGVPRFRRVIECNTGRVFVLRFEGVRQRHFFWMQEAYPERDNDFCQRFNELIKASKEPEKPKIVFSAVATELATDRPRDGGGCDVPAPPTPPPPSPTPGKGVTMVTNLLGFFLKMGQSMISLAKSTLSPEGTMPQPFQDPYQRQTKSLATTMHHQMSTVIELNNFSSESLHRLVARLPMDPDREEIECHTTSLPATVVDTLKVGLVADHVRSPQFYEALMVFQYAFQRCQLVGSLQELSVGPEALEAAQDGDFEEFLYILNSPDAYRQ
ncbi:proteasomal ubiquitin receptor ADRM1 homolog [Drosophila madeirensis]|uniref:Proteasomal ubiquitin receptor ADRM1 homolog n=2 Tax=Drosophila madeirensis TaxID=30013 RepID=A0AAU9FXU0_DROMD